MALSGERWIMKARGRACWLLSAFCGALLLMVGGLEAQEARPTVALLSCAAKGGMRDADVQRAVGVVEEALLGHGAFSVLRYQESRSRLAAMAPEIVGCLTTGCLALTGNALEAQYGIVVEIEEELQFFTFRLRLFELRGGQLQHSNQGSCEVCTAEEALEALSAMVRSSLRELGAPQARTQEVVVKAVMGEVRVAIFATPDDTEIGINGAPVARGRHVGTLPPGTHEVVLTREGFGAVTEQLALQDGDGPTYLVVHLRPLTTPVFTGGRTGGWVESLDRDLWAWTLTGGGTVLGVAGVVLLAIDGETTCSGAVQDCERVFSTRAGGAVALGLGVAALSAGVTLFLWEHLAGTSSSSVAVGFDPQGTQVVLGGRF